MQEKLNSFTLLKEETLYSISEYLEPRDGKKNVDRPIILDELKLGRGSVDARLAAGSLSNDILLVWLVMREKREAGEEGEYQLMIWRDFDLLLPIDGCSFQRNLFVALP